MKSLTLVGVHLQIEVCKEQLAEVEEPNVDVTASAVLVGFRLL